MSLIGLSDLCTLLQLLLLLTLFPALLSSLFTHLSLSGDTVIPLSLSSDNSLYYNFNS